MTILQSEVLSDAAKAHAARQPALRIAKVSKSFGELLAVDNVDLEFSEGEFVTLVGPSGCGKTTLLRMIAGLETPTGGEIEVHGQKVFSSTDGIKIPPNRRGLGMVFQSYALWPHMTANENVGYPLMRHSKVRSPFRRKRHRVEVNERVNAVLKTVGCEALGGRYPSEMSGGQQQRIALARAIVNSPRLVLMDEPLSNLDAKLRSRLRFELRDLQQELGFTAVYVTHDRAEALSMADTVVVLREGRVEQVGEPRAVYGTPSSTYVADFLGDHNMVDGVVTSAHDGVPTAETELGFVPLPSSSDLAPGTRTKVGVSRDEVQLVHAAERDPSRFGSLAVVAGVSYCGWFSEILIRTTSGDELTVRASGEPSWAVGDEVVATVAHMEVRNNQPERIDISDKEPR